MNYKIGGHVNLCTCPLFCVLNCCCCCCVASSHNNNISLYIFPNLPLKGLGGRVKPYFLASCQVRFASGVLGVLMDLVLCSSWTSLAPYCIDSTLCRLTCTFRGLAWTPQILKQRRVAFNWHTFSEDLPDLVCGEVPLTDGCHFDSGYKPLFHTTGWSQGIGTAYRSVCCH
jgi:hypothetical protein